MTSNVPLGPPSTHVRRLVQALRRGGQWWAVGQELLMQTVPLADDRFVPRLEELVDLAFYASMTTEEAQRAIFSIALAKPSSIGHEFTHPVPLTVKLLRKLSAACHDDGTSVFAWFDETQWFVWGVGVNEKAPPRSGKTRGGTQHLLITVRDAGALDARWQDEVLFTYGEGKGEVLGEQLWVAESVKAALPAPAPDRIAMHHLVAIQRSMRRHGRGGALLVVPSPPAGVEVAYPMKRSFPMQARKKLGELHEGPLAQATMTEEAFRRGVAEMDGEDTETSDEALLRYATDRTDAEAAMIGSLTAIDGLVIIDHAMCVLGFGSKIPVPSGFGKIAVTHIDALDRSETPTSARDFFTGMRHKSAASVCAQARNALALVQSQDGALSVMIAKDGALTVISPLAHLIDPAHRWTYKR